MNTTQLLLELSALTGVSGREEAAARRLGELLSPYGEVKTSPLGSIYATVREPKEGGPHVLLAAHMDEIGLVVTYIEENGFLRVAPVGGVDRRIITAAPVTIHTENGPVKGVVTSIPPHLQKGEETDLPHVEDVFVDIGCDGAEAARRVRLGDRATIDAQSRELLGGLVSGKALDNRASCACILKALELVQGEDLPCGLTVAFTTQEETGGVGAKTVAHLVNPTHAVALDVSFGHTPDAPRHKCGILEGGPMIGIAPILDCCLSRKLEEIAKKENIPFQLEVMNSSTGTDADSIAGTGCGIKTALISIPERYMHSPIEVLSPRDVDHTAQLLAAFLKEVR